MQSTIDEVRSNLRQRLETARTSNDVRSLQIEFLGKKGIVTALLKQIAAAPPEKRREVGEAVNSTKQWAEASIDRRLLELDDSSEHYCIDFTLPGRILPIGKKHVLSQVEEEIESIFLSMGFDVEEGPEIEDEYHNFEALNIPK